MARKRGSRSAFTSLLKRALREKADPNAREWVGGMATMPGYVVGEGEPYRPCIVMWLEEPEGLILGSDFVKPGGERGAVGRALVNAMRSPMIGPPRRPERVRVADAALVPEIRAELGDAVAIDVAPTPELDALVAAMAEAMPSDEEPSYLEDGRLPPAVLEYLFGSAQALHRAAPWKLPVTDFALRIDIPELGVEGACLALMGSLGESFGFLLFPSLEALDAFQRSGERLMHAPPRSGPVDLGSAHLSLEFEKRSALTRTQRKEAAKHGWPVDGVEAYPVVKAHERDAVVRPLEERDVRIAALCAGAVASFSVRCREVFEREDAEPGCASFTDEHPYGTTVTVTAPYEAFDLFERPAAAPTPAPPLPRKAEPPVLRASRNAPCPCGSGKKYKKCHLPIDEAEAAPRKRTQAIHALDQRLVCAINDFATQRWGARFHEAIGALARSPREHMLSVPFGAFVMPLDGSTVLDHYLAERAKRLNGEERGWLEAQRAAWLSVWEATEVEPGKGLMLRDALTGESRRVTEVLASQSIRVRDALLGRVVDYAGFSLLCGLHSRPLGPRDAAQVATTVRKRLRERGAVPIDSLRSPAVYRYLVDAWGRAVRKAERRAARPVDLRNTDGDPFLFTTDLFGFDAAARPDVEARLAAMSGAEPESAPDRGADDDAAFVFTVPGNRKHASWDNTIVGRAELGAASLRLETNSIARADRLRARVEEACGGLLRHRARTHEDPQSKQRSRPGPPAAERPLPPEAAQLALDFKARHYAAWLDEPIPALSGRTPRQAASSAQGRAALDVLLKEMEQWEAAGDAASAYDVTQLRRELGLE